MSQSVTESDSHYNNLEDMSVMELIQAMNKEDLSVPKAVNLALPQIESLIKTIVTKMQNGGRLFYIGAGTSGRLGILDASECPPTFGVPHNWVIGLIAGGDSAIRKAVEFAEDNTEQAFKDLQQYNVTANDVVVGIAASGKTPYVYGGLKMCQSNNITTGCVVCNPDSLVASYSDHPVEVIVGPEFITGSSRLKAGTAQKLVLNMITTATMIQLGRVKGNKMVDMQLSNNKLVNRGTRMIMQEFNITYQEAKTMLQTYGSVRKAIQSQK